MHSFGPSQKTIALLSPILYELGSLAGERRTKSGILSYFYCSYKIQERFKGIFERRRSRREDEHLHVPKTASISGKALDSFLFVRSRTVAFPLPRRRVVSTTMETVAK